MITVFYILILNSVIFMMVNSPGPMLLVTISQTFLTCLFMKTFFQMSWMLIILFLVFIGGLMVLFVYIVSLVPNTTNLLYKPIIFMMPLVIFSGLMIKLANFNAPLMNMSWTHYYPIILKAYSMSNPYLILLVVTYLLLALLVIAFIILKKSGPLRSTSSYGSNN